MRDSGLEEGHGEDRTQSRHTLNSLPLSLPPPCFSRGPTMFPPLYYVFSPVTSSLPLSLPLSISSPLSYLYHAVSSINLPLCVSKGVGGGPHSVSHSSSINDQLEHGATQSPPPIPPPPATTSPHLTQPLPPCTRTHPISIIFASFEDKSAFFYLFPFPFSLSLPLSPPSGYISQGSSHVLLTSAAWLLLL